MGEVLTAAPARNGAASSGTTCSNEPERARSPRNWRASEYEHKRASGDQSTGAIESKETFEPHRLR